MNSSDTKALPAGHKIFKIPLGEGIRIPNHEFKDGFVGRQNEHGKLMRVKIENDKHTATAYYFDGTCRTYDIKN